MTRRRIDADVFLEIEGRLIRGHTPAQVERALAREAGGWTGRIPTLRTIQRMGRDVARDDAGRWKLSPVTADPVIVMAALSASLADGWRAPIAQREAEWITAIGQAVPELTPLSQRSVARLYLAAEGREESTAWLDQLLAIGPWRGGRERGLADALGLPKVILTARR